jgi:hypothetical protein
MAADNAIDGSVLDGPFRERQGAANGICVF